jgi:hypothetical protein
VLVLAEFVVMSFVYYYAFGWKVITASTASYKTPSLENLEAMEQQQKNQNHGNKLTGGSSGKGSQFVYSNFTAVASNGAGDAVCGSAGHIGGTGGGGAGGGAGGGFVGSSTSTNSLLNVALSGGGGNSNNSGGAGGGGATQGAPGAGTESGAGSESKAKFSFFSFVWDVLRFTDVMGTLTYRSELYLYVPLEDDGAG